MSDDPSHVFDVEQMFAVFANFDAQGRPLYHRVVLDAGGELVDSAGVHWTVE